MIGVFDSGLGGLTVLRALVHRFPGERFVYLGDHANVPYGNRPAGEVLALTELAVERLFRAGCRLALLGCNTATAVAARQLQQVWLPQTTWRQAGHNVLGIIAPTVEAATQTPWAVTTPQYPQRYNTDTVVVFGTARTTSSGVYPEEIRKRCPKVTVVQVTCPGLVDAIEGRAGRAACAALVAEACETARAATEGQGHRPPDRAILGCTHFPLVEDLFRAHLPAVTRILSQPEIVADSLEDYLVRHPHYASLADASGSVRLFTTGEVANVTEAARIFWPDAPPFAPFAQGIADAA